MIMNQTPIQLLGNFEGNTLYIKREDLLPYCFGGNKARKAMLFFRTIDEKKYDCVVTYGSSSSNHCRVVSNMCAARKIRCIIISPDSASKPTYNSLMMKKFGAEIRNVPVAQVHDTIEDTLNEVKAEGYNPYFIPGGGHGNLGTQAYVDCYREIKAFEKENDLSFDFIFLASGTGTTQAGLVCGKMIENDDRSIVGISIARKNPYGRNVICESIHDFLGDRVTKEQIDKQVIFIDKYNGGGYGVENKEILLTIENVLTSYGIPLDVTYTGKAFYGMQRYLNENEILGRKVLFIHTGGAPLFFDWLNSLADDTERNS